MRQLRLVRLADDTGDLVLESADGLERFALMIDDTLRATVAGVPEAVAPLSSGAVPGPVAAPPARHAVPEVHVGPREIQVRVRAGESPQELADSLGVPIERVMRFAGPVMDERRRITDEARRARARRTGTENEFVLFGEKVDARFTAHGIDAADILWDSRRRDDGDWVVAAEWSGGEGRHGAEWLFHRSSRCVTPLDDTAGDLLSDRPIRPVVPPAPERPALSVAPPLAPGVVAFPPMPDAHTGPLPRIDDVFDQDAPAEGPLDLPPYVPAAIESAAAAEPAEPAEPARDARPAEPVRESAAEPQFAFDEPPLPLGLTEPAHPELPARPLASLTNARKHRAQAESDDDKAARARIPSWDDILLGVRRKQD
ncbi:septation protein SepH [Jatrophihabitans fulvus]